METAYINPIVLETGSLPDFLQYLLTHHAPPSTLIVCTTKSAFLAALHQDSATTAPQENTTSEETTITTTSSPQNPFSNTLPTLRLLSTSRTLKLAFCPDTTHLRAYLSSLPTKHRQTPSNAFLQIPRLRAATPLLAILDPIALHRPTSAFSAQGLNRTFATAVEAAAAMGRKLVLCEVANGEQDGSVWDEELSILNVTTKRLGEMSVGRAVSARRVAGRWCTFQKLEGDEGDEE